jgi:hypothetical protein
MTDYVKTAITFSDVMAGIKHAWYIKRGEVTLSGVLAVALTVATSLSDGGVALGLTLIGAVLTNLGRIITATVLEVREGRDLDTYLQRVFAKYESMADNLHDSLIGWDGPEAIDLDQKPETD